MRAAGRNVSISELETFLFYTTRYVLTQEFIPLEIVDMVRRYSTSISTPMKRDLGFEINRFIDKRVSNEDSEEEIESWRELAQKLIRS